MLRRVLLLGACGSAFALESVVELRIAGGKLPEAQRRIVALQGDRLRWRVSSDAPGELHLHAYRLAVRVGPGSPQELAFTAAATGRFPLEWHAGAGQHHEAPLAWLEVRPR
ncbi:hypothetical protein HHL11_12725 [Ramlibacter sp. G-1-2-2]|uniref:Uncharacterized protein n=1 Tax=Ramlibacter agri TaxID=2728837 RepID=A0A848H4D4_9BURK|nr:hypothetical protein [Ramlibacter agri]NML44622.1 hypothetical protein [Ramlibacter agri]